jgi:hypothetical protein
MCWALNHQNTMEMAQGHISLSATNTFSAYVIDLQLEVWHAKGKWPLPFFSKLILVLDEHHNQMH